MNIEEIENFLSTAHDYAETSKRTYRDVIPRILDQVEDPAGLTPTELIRLLHKSGWGNNRQCLALFAIKKFLTWKYGAGHPALQAKLKRIVGKPQRALDKPTALKLLASFDAYSAKGARDLAICSLALDTGLRESEICRLELADTDLEHRVLQVIIKGGQWAAAIYSDETAAHIERWLHFRKIADGQGFLFTHTKTGAGLKPGGLYSIVKEWGNRIGIDLSVHMFRRSMATIGTMNGASERSLMEMGRWSDSKMIKNYTRTLRLEHLRKFLPVPGLMNDDPTNSP
jgi:integrase